MRMVSVVQRWWTRWRRRAPRHSEQDVARDPHQATSRVAGGPHRPEQPDAHSSTGTGHTSIFVGRVAGQDIGYCEETGAERRATNGQSSADTDTPSSDTGNSG